MKLYKDEIWKECPHCGHRECESRRVLGCDNCSEQLKDDGHEIMITVFYDSEVSHTEDFYFCSIKCWLNFVKIYKVTRDDFYFMSLPNMELNEFKEFVNLI